MKIIFFIFLTLVAFAEDDGSQLLKQARVDIANGNNYAGLQKLFLVQKNNENLAPEAYNEIIKTLSRLKMWNTATYFYLKGLKSGQERMIEAVTPFTALIVNKIGLDMVQTMMLKNSQLKHYTGVNRDYFLYVGGKFLFSRGKYEKVGEYLSLIPKGSPVYPFARFVMGSAKTILGQINSGIADFIACRDGIGSGDTVFATKAELKDLGNRCTTGIARSYYQVEDFEKSYLFYDEVDRTSMIWAETLLEAAWGAYSIEDYNRTLGKLVTYKAPILSFVYNPEIDVLRAQSYLKMCLYDDAKIAISEFKAKYILSGKNLLQYLKTHKDQFEYLFQEGLRVSKKKLTEADDVEKVMNTFVREPYFMSLVKSDSNIEEEVRILNRMTNGNTGQGLGRILNNIIRWRQKKNEEIGGRFIQRNLYTNYKRLLTYLDQITYIKLEVLNAQRNTILKKMDQKYNTRARGSLGAPKRKDHQYIWTFNGEFWLDELGDYVFALKSECST